MSDHGHPPNEPVREREVVVTDGGRRGGGGGLVALVVGVVAVLLLVVLLFSLLGGDDGGGEADVQVPDVEVPDEVDVEVEGGGEGSG